MVGIAFLLLLSVQFVLVSTCDFGWHFFNDRCFFFDLREKAWEDAEKVCTAMQAQLAEVNTPELNHWLPQKMIAQSLKNVWIGGGSFSTNPNFYLLPSNRPDSNYENWDRDEPKNAESDNCVLLNSHRRYTWASAHCSNTNSYICMKPRCQVTSYDGAKFFVNLNSVKAGVFQHKLNRIARLKNDNNGRECEDGFQKFAEKCYVFITHRLKWYDALEKCNSMKSDLAEIDYPDLSSWIEQQALNVIPYMGHIWIGGSNLNSNDRWEWKKSQKAITYYVNWSPTELYKQGRYLRGVRMSAKGYVHWEVEWHKYKYPFLCEKRV